MTRRLTILYLFAATVAVLASGAEASDGVDAWAFDGALRERATLSTAVDFDASNPDEGWFWTQRLSLNAEGPVTDTLSARFSLVSALQSGVDASPVNQNNLDFQEAYLDWQIAGTGVRLGRQEVILGSQRLVGSREGTNVRRTWDGLRVSGDIGRWHWDAFGVRLVNVEPNGVLNDSSNSNRSLAGLYLSGPMDWTSLDVYYLYSRVKNRPTIEGTANQERHSLGVRVFGEANNWFWNWEAIGQFGRHGSDDIEAWTLATNTGYRMDAPWSPEFMLSINVASGDSDPTDGKLETFDALYPRGNYFSELALLGPANFYNLNPTLSLKPTEDVDVSLRVNWYWRLETSDGVYGPPGNLLRAPLGSDERFVNLAYSLSAAWRLNKTWRLTASLTHSRPQDFIQETGVADITNFGEFSLIARF